MKIADSDFLSLFTRDNEKCDISHAPITKASLEKEYIEGAFIKCSIIACNL